MDLFFGLCIIDVMKQGPVLFSILYFTDSVGVTQQRMGQQLTAQDQVDKRGLP
jgi:hypothetical protein